MYSAYLFDLDGTIYVGDTLLPGAAETITALRKAGRRTIFLSNNPTKTRSQYTTKLMRMGIPTPIKEGNPHENSRHGIVQSSTALAFSENTHG